MVNYSAMWPLLSLYEIVTIFVDINADKHLVSAGYIKHIVTIEEPVAAILVAYLPRMAPNYLCIEVSDQVPLQLHMMLTQQLLKLCRVSLSIWGSKHIGAFFAYQGGQYVEYI
jgi:hypothetical protein